jgi:hypothetical protein
MISVTEQLEIHGLARTKEMVAGSELDRRRWVQRVETTHDIMSELPGADDLSFLHSGLCQTCLPHRRLRDDRDPWRRTSGRFSLIVTPGVLEEQGVVRYVGVPYGPKARLIMIHLQTEGMKSRTVNLGSSLSAWLRSLGLAVTGGPRGTITAVREQSVRIARCAFSMQWTSSVPDGGQRTVISDTRIVEGMEMWRAGRGTEWSSTVELSERFHTHLREHAVPLDRRGIAHLSANSLGLDLYTLFAYRLPKLQRDLHLRWSALQEQIGSDESSMKSLAQRIREVMADVLVAYPHAKVEVTRHGLLLKPSKPAVPKTSVNGYQLIGQQASDEAV